MYNLYITIIFNNGITIWINYEDYYLFIPFQLYLLKVVSFLVPFLMAMKKRMKIPHMMKMLPNMSGPCLWF